jgi:UDP-N-acetylglucosamine 2-epimerase (non-hydrolysing)
MNLSFLVLTNSRDVQEVSPSNGKSVLVIQDTTERTEAIGAGSENLVGTNKNTIIFEVEKLLHD